MVENPTTLRVMYGLCAVAFVVIVARAFLNVKGPEDFVFTVPQQEVQAYAKQQLGALQQRSFASDKELCAIIFEDSDGNLGTTPIREGDVASCDITFFDEPGMGPIASFHTHGSFDRNYDSEVPSDIDIESDIASGSDGYVSTPGGRFWRIDAAAQKAIQICGEGCLEQDPDFKPCPPGAIAEEYSRAELNARARQTVSAC